MTDKVAVTQEDLALANRIVREFRSDGWPAKEKELAHLLAISREATRIATAEACARIAEEMVEPSAVEFDQGFNAAASRIARKIRRRLQQGSEKP